jgi:hypothetical protein
MIIEDEPDHFGAAKFLRMWNVEVEVDAGGGYLVEDGELKFKLNERELVVFAHGYCTGMQRPRRHGKRNDARA